MGQHQGKAIFLTGASTGIGRATALRLAEEGASLVLADIAKDKLEKTTKECQSLGSETISIECDVSNEMQISEAISEMAKQFGEIHAVINIAGIQLWSHSHEHSLTDFERTLAVNLTGTFLVCREAIPYLLKTSGSIVNVSSTTALAGIPYSVAYAASKAGVLALTKSLAVEYGGKGLQVNCINPGGIKTEMTKKSWSNDTIHEERKKKTFLDRWGTPTDIAGTVLFLASDASSYITGQDIYVDGGWTAKGL